MEPCIQPVESWHPSAQRPRVESPSTPGDVTTHREQDLSPSSCLGAEQKEGYTARGIRVGGETAVLSPDNATHKKYPRRGWDGRRRGGLGDPFLAVRVWESEVLTSWQIDVFLWCEMFLSVKMCSTPKWHLGLWGCRTKVSINSSLDVNLASIKHSSKTNIQTGARIQEGAKDMKGK